MIKAIVRLQTHKMQKTYTDNTCKIHFYLHVLKYIVSNGSFFHV